MLEAAKVKEVFVDNSEVGHGMDHPEIGVMYEWLEKWNVSEGVVPRGGVMGWPMVAFLDLLPEHKDLFPTDPSQEVLNTFAMGHFGAGLCEPYTDCPTVVCTPNCPRPDAAAGYRAQITTTNPEQSLQVIHAEQRRDWETMAHGVFAAVRMFDHLQAQGIVGKRLEPPFEVNVANSEQLVAWIRENHFTVFHWACTCKAGVNGSVADAHFRVRNPQQDAEKGLVNNLLVGSAASLPDMPDANPHLTITAFSFALAEELVRTQAERRHRGYKKTAELRKAESDLHRRVSAMAGQFTRKELVESQQLLQVRRYGEEYPNLHPAAVQHYKEWLKEHPVDKP